MFESLKRELYLKIIFVYFIFLNLLWLFANCFHHHDSIWHALYTNIYGLVALFGGISGIYIAKKWGGFQSFMGRAILGFSFGLLAQEFGQLSYNYYIYLKGIEVPYPSIGDLGFLGYIPLYMIGMFYIAKVSGVRVSLQRTSAKLLTFFIPILIISLSYFFFLQGYSYDWSSPFLILFDLGYPLGQASNLSILIITYLLSKKYLGGVMKSKILFLIIAFAFQYICDFTFLYQANRELWYAGGISDFMYLISYTLMTIGLFELKTTSDKLTKN